MRSFAPFGVFAIALVACAPAKAPSARPATTRLASTRPASSIPASPAPEPTAEAAPPPVEPGLDPAPPSPPTPAPAPARVIPVFAESSGKMFRSDVPAQIGNDASKPASGEKYVVRLERTACYGACPQYSVELWANGNVVYTDKDASSQVVTGKLPAAAVAALAKKIADASFFRLTWDEPCKRRWTDNPSAIVTLVRQGRQRTIADDQGNMCMPSVLRDLENEIDRVASTADYGSGAPAAIH